MPTDATERLCLWMELLSGLDLCPAIDWRFDEWWTVLCTIDTTDARVLVLRIVHGLDWPEIAELMEVSRMRCYQRFERAIRRIRLPRDVTELRNRITGMKAKH